MTDYEKKRYEQYKLAYAALMLCYPFMVDDLDGEIWHDIKGYEGRYEISNYGRVNSCAKGEWRILKPLINHCGYLYVILYHNSKGKIFKIHRLVAEAFVPNSENKPTVNHIDGNKMNAFVENLEWVTPSENNLHAIKIGLVKTGEKNSRAKLTEEQVRYIRKVHKKGDPEFGMGALARKFGVTLKVMYDVIHYKHYKNVT